MKRWALAIIAWIVVAVVVGGFLVYRHRRVCNHRIVGLLDAMKMSIAHDTCADYRKACGFGEQIIVELDPHLFSAHALLA
jgi:hypothetical protein